jgi:hypothetical protein
VDPEQTWAQIRQHTSGKRIAVLTNRDDKPLKKTLEKLLDVKIRWVVTKPRQIDALTKSVKSDVYYMVIAFTGFMHHKDGAAISAAARSSGTLYIRANKGRPTTVMLALARDLGIE